MVKMKKLENDKEKGKVFFYNTTLQKKIWVDL